MTNDLLRKILMVAFRGSSGNREGVGKVMLLFQDPEDICVPLNLIFGKSLSLHGFRK